MEKLSKAYTKAKRETYAYCTNCGEAYIDDIATYGSLYCPNEDCKYEGGRCVLIRGCTEDRCKELEELRKEDK